MKAARILDASPPFHLELAEVPKPIAGPQEILIRVSAAGVTPTELLWYPTTHTRLGTVRLQAIPGHEFSGIIEAVGPGVQGLSPGDEIYGMNDWFQEGATAEFCIATPETIAPRPRKLSLAEAASVPIAALTAWQALFERAKLKSGDRVLVHGGAGSVGSFVIQLAKLHGAEVIATASGQNMHFVRSIKADEVIDYKTTRFEEVITKVDVVFDAVGGDTLARSWPLLRDSDRAVTIAAGNDQSSDPRVNRSFFIVRPDCEQLMNVSLLIDGGSLRPFLGGTAPLARVENAYRGHLPRKDDRGKIVLILPDPPA